MELSPDQAQRMEHAREALDGPPAREPAEMAARIGALEWHLSEMLSIVSRQEFMFRTASEVLDAYPADGHAVSRRLRAVR